jgi:hypothetical protein
MVLALAIPVFLTSILLMYFMYQAMLLPENLMHFVDKFIIRIDKDAAQTAGCAGWQNRVNEEELERSEKQIEQLEEIEEQENEEQGASVEKLAEGSKNIYDDSEPETEEDKTESAPPEEPIRDRFPTWLDNSRLDLQISEEDQERLLRIDDGAEGKEAREAVAVALEMIKDKDKPASLTYVESTGLWVAHNIEMDAEEDAEPEVEQGEFDAEEEED